jgi:hypothetical protein
MSRKPIAKIGVPGAVMAVFLLAGPAVAQNRAPALPAIRLEVPTCHYGPYGTYSEYYSPFGAGPSTFPYLRNEFPYSKFSYYVYPYNTVGSYSSSPETQLKSYQLKLEDRRTTP